MCAVTDISVITDKSKSYMKQISMQVRISTWY